MSCELAFTVIELHHAFVSFKVIDSHDMVHATCPQLLGLVIHIDSVGSTDLGLVDLVEGELSFLRDVPKLDLPFSRCSQQ